MRAPNPINLQTPQEVRAAGWAAEARDKDGHLVTVRARLGNDAEWGRFIREETAMGFTVTIWPITDKEADDA